MIRAKKPPRRPPVRRPAEAPLEVKVLGGLGSGWGLGVHSTLGSGDNGLV